MYHGVALFPASASKTCDPRLRRRGNRRLDRPLRTVALVEGRPDSQADGYPESRCAERSTRRVSRSRRLKGEVAVVTCRTMLTDDTIMGLMRQKLAPRMRVRTARRHTDEARRLRRSVASSSGSS